MTSAVTDEPSEKRRRIIKEEFEEPETAAKPAPANSFTPADDFEESNYSDVDPDSNFDSDSMSSDSDCEDGLPFPPEVIPFLPLPLRLMSSAIKCSPELTSQTKHLIELSEARVRSEKACADALRAKCEVQTEYLRLKNMKLQMEIQALERSARAGSSTTAGANQDTTIYLHTT